MKNTINLQKISHHFDTPDGKITLFEDLSLCLNNHSTHAIIGPSGAGKSSLLTLAAGLEVPRAGTVEFTLDSKPSDMISIRQNSGFIFQQFHLMHELDAIGNVALPLRLKGNKNAYKIAEEWLSKIGLQDRAHHRPNQLSGGEQQRIAIARAFVTNPAFVFADEPTGNLDENTSANVADLMFDFAVESGCALILVTHSRELAARADTCHKLHHRRLEQIK